MKVLVISEFIDKESGERMVKGKELDLNPFRAGQLFAKGRVKLLEEYVEPVAVEPEPEKKEQPAEPEPEKKEVEQPHTKKHERK